jgi:hypothetical protein
MFRARLNRAASINPINELLRDDTAKRRRPGNLAIDVESLIMAGIAAAGAAVSVGALLYVLRTAPKFRAATSGSGVAVLSGSATLADADLNLHYFVLSATPVEVKLPPPAMAAPNGALDALSAGTWVSVFSGSSATSVIVPAPQGLFVVAVAADRGVMLMVVTQQSSRAWKVVREW